VIQGLARNPKNSALRFVQLLGRKFDDQLVQATLGDYSCKVADKDGMPSLQPTDVPEGVAPGELVSKFLTMMWETAETNAGADRKEMVVAVPHGASEEYKEALKAACTTAGVGVTAFITEPLAVAVGYEGNASPADGNILVYDLGASKATVTILKVTSGCYNVLGSVEDTKLGGNALDALTIKMLIKEFKKSSKMDVTDDRKALAKLKQAAVDAKHILSSNANTTVAIESLFEGADFQMKLSRGKFDSTVASLYRKSAVPIEAALAATGLKKEDISSVLLAGGGSNAAKVKKTLEMYFEREIVKDTIPADEVIALGASRHGVQLAAIDAEVVAAATVCPKAICVKAADGSMQTVIPAGALCPVTVELELSAAADQNSVSLQVYEQGEPPKYLAKAMLSDVAAGAAITGAIEMLTDGTLRVSLSSADETVEGSVQPSR
jgi:molecular chaperone DnaK (HSP70)